MSLTNDNPHRGVVTLVTQGHECDEFVLKHYTPQVARYMDNPVFDSLEHVAHQTEIFERQRELGNDLLYIICIGSNYAGQLAVMGIGDVLPEVGLWVAEKYQGQGVGLAAVMAAQRLALPSKSPFLAYPVLRENTRSIGLARKLASTALSLGDTLLFLIPRITPPFLPSFEAG